MTASLIVVALGTVVAAVGTGVLAARCARTPKVFLVAWSVAVFALAVALAAQALGYLAGYSDPIFRAMELGAQAVALAAQALGYLAGYSDPIFRAMELGAQAVAPLALCLGLVELIAWGLPGRFAMRLAVSAIGVVVLVIMGTDPLSTNATLSKSWPDPAVFYQLIPLGLIDFLAAFTLVTAVISALVVLARSNRGPAYAEVTKPALMACAAAVLIALPGLLIFLHMHVGGAVFAALAVLATVLTWLAAVAAARSAPAHDRGHADRDRRQPAGPGWYDSDDRSGDRHDDDDDYLTSAYRDDAAHGGRSAGSGRRFADSDSDIAYPALAALAAERPDQAGRPDPDRYDSAQFDSAQFDSGQYDSAQYDSAQFDSAKFDSGLQPGIDVSVIEPYDARAGLADRPAAAGGHSGQLFGQITIYTLLDDRLDDFDRMTEGVVQQVTTLEPGTLVYIVHAVPTAPMQRILYEVYRDRAAYDEHLAQPYVARYVAERRTMVLATNAIELGLRQAKISPLPSYSAISDILSESGIDLTGVTKSSRGSRQGGGYRAQGGHHGETVPREQPARRSGGYDSRPSGTPGDARGHDQDEPGYEGWSGLRDEDPWYR